MYEVVVVVLVKVVLAVGTVVMLVTISVVKVVPFRILVLTIRVVEFNQRVLYDVIPRFVEVVTVAVRVAVFR